MNPVPFTPGVRSAAARPGRTRQVIRQLPVLAATIGVIALLGCEDPAPVEHRVIGIIDFDNPNWRLPQIPETATAMVPFEILVWTGGNSCHRAGGTQVSSWGRNAVVVPYDYRPFESPTDNDLGCFTGRGLLRHSANVVFEEPGTAEIVLVYSTEGGWRPEHYKGDGRKVYTVEVAEAVD